MQPLQTGSCAAVPVGLQDVDDADVHQQPLPLGVPRRDAARPAQTSLVTTQTTPWSHAPSDTHSSSDSIEAIAPPSAWMDSMAVLYRDFWPCGRRWSEVPATASAAAWSTLWMASRRL